MPIYTQSTLQAAVNRKIKGKIGVLIDVEATLNEGVMEVLADLDLLTTRRRVALVPNLFSGLFEYAAPTDLKGYSIISIQNQKWTQTPFWSLVPYEQFMRRQDANTLAISDYDFTRKLFIKSEISDVKTTLSNMDSLTSGGGTWSAFGDATNVEAANDNSIDGVGSIKFDLSAAGGTTAGIVNSTLTSVDLSSYFNGDGNCVVWAYITSTTGITNFIVRIGSSASNYYTKTVTSQADGTAFVDGWNLLNFDLSTFTTVGTPTDTAIRYCALYMTKLGTKISEVGYRFDQLILRRGEINNVYYYSGCGWQDTTGVYKFNSTTASDFLNAGEEEYKLIVAKCSELAADEVDEEKVSQKEASTYSRLMKVYKTNNPSEALQMISTVADFVKI